MLYELPGFQASRSRDYDLDDLTVIVGIRAHDQNPWLLQRLELLGQCPGPRPRFVVVDFGSPARHRDEVLRIGHSGGLDVVLEDDFGTFSAAKARNVGARHATTDLLFFTDIDCVGPIDLYQRLIDQANALELGSCFDQMINLPAYHLDARATAEYVAQKGPRRASTYLNRILTQAPYLAKGACEYVDPFSNFFVCHRRFFDWVGGFNENFRGHGSEDYEFQLRFFMHSGQFPLPNSPHEDVYGVLREAFYGTKTYRGFRRFGEVFALQSQLSGLRLAHLFHERPRDTDDWYRSRDKTRERFEAEAKPFLDDPTKLLAYDWMPRDKRAVALIQKSADPELIMPLRLAGYRLEPVTLGDAATEQRALSQIERREVDAIVVVEPSLDVENRFLRLARQRGVDPIVVRRGLLPESIRCHVEPPHHPAPALQGFEPARVTEAELRLADEYVRRITQFGLGYGKTMARYAAAARKHSSVCLVRLAETELPQDFTALTHARADTLFLASKEGDDDLATLLTLADTVLTDDPETALRGLLHGKVVVSLERTPSFPTYTEHAATLHDALALLAHAKLPAPDPLPLVAWLIHHHYGFVRDGRTYQFHFGEGHFSQLRARSTAPFDLTSYASGLLGVAVPGEGVSPDSNRYASNRFVRKLRKLTRNPRRFFLDSSQVWFRWLGKLGREPRLPKLEAPPTEITARSEMLG